MADNDDKAAAIAPATAAGGDDEEEEDLEKLSAEIARMEEEAARIAAETEELEKANATSAATATTTSSTKAKSGCVVSGSIGDSSEEKIKKDGYVAVTVVMMMRALVVNYVCVANYLLYCLLISLIILFPLMHIISAS